MHLSIYIYKCLSCIHTVDDMLVWIWLVWRKYIYNTDDRMNWIIDFRLCHTIWNYLSLYINLFICLLICITKKEPIYKFLLRRDNSTCDDICNFNRMVDTFKHLPPEMYRVFRKKYVFFQKCSVFCTSLSPAELHLVIQKITIYSIHAHYDVNFEDSLQWGIRKLKHFFLTTLYHLY